MGTRNDDISLILAKAKKQGFLPDVKDEEVDILTAEAKELFGKDLTVNPRTDNGEYFMSALDCGISPLRAGVAGDSTASDPPEWADSLMVKLGLRYTDRTIEIPHWNDATQAYNAPTVIQTGTVANGVAFHDTFTRTAGELYNTQPDIGPVWGRDGSNAMGDWTIDGSAAVSTSDATQGVLIANVSPGNHKVTSSITMSTLSRGTATNWDPIRLIKDFSSNYIFARIAVSTAGVPTAYMYKRVAGVQTAIGTLNTPIASNTASVTFTAILERNGTQVNLTVNGNNVAHTLTAEEVALLEGTSMIGMSKSSVAGDKVNDFKVELSGAVPPILTFYNGSMSGSKLEYQQARLALMYPQPLDLLFVSAGHNYGSATAPNDFIKQLDSFISDFRAIQPNAGIIITSQNPQKSPASAFTAHLNRQAVIRSYASSRGFGYIPVIEKWLKQANKGNDLIATDGVHPIDAGSNLWRDLVYDYLLTKSI